MFGFRKATKVPIGDVPDTNCVIPSEDLLQRNLLDRTLESNLEKVMLFTDKSYVNVSFDVDPSKSLRFSAGMTCKQFLQEFNNKYNYVLIQVLIKLTIQSELYTKLIECVKDDDETDLIGIFSTLSFDTLFVDSHLLHADAYEIYAEHGDVFYMHPAQTKSPCFGIIIDISGDITFVDIPDKYHIVLHDGTNYVELLKHTIANDIQARLNSFQQKSNMSKLEVINFLVSQVPDDIRKSYEFLGGTILAYVSLQIMSGRAYPDVVLMDGVLELLTDKEEI